MSDTQLVQYIRGIPKLYKLWVEMTKAEHHVLVAEAEGETLLLKELMEDIIDRRNAASNNP